MRKAVNIAGAVLLALLLAAGAVIGLAFKLEHKRFDLPRPSLRASGDAAVIERGRYLVHGPAHCADCHAGVGFEALVERGEEVPLSGGGSLDIYLGEIRFPNITGDPVTGIGARKDGELARFFRHGVDHRGEIGLPFMQYADLADSDLIAVISYLRTLPPVFNRVPPSRYNLLGKVTRAYFLEPFAPSASPPASPSPGRTEEFGGYLVNAVANCASCHTARNMKTGEYTGPRFGGGMVFHRAGDRSRTVISPNLTPDPETGIMAAWDEAAFVRRFKSGKVREWSPMPWGPLSRTSGDDLAAMYRYLSTLKPVSRPPVKD